MTQHSPQHVVCHTLMLRSESQWKSDGYALCDLLTLVTGNVVTNKVERMVLPVIDPLVVVWWFRYTSMNDRWRGEIYNFLPPNVTAVDPLMQLSLIRLLPVLSLVPSNVEASGWLPDIDYARSMKQVMVLNLCLEHTRFSVMLNWFDL